MVKVRGQGSGVKIGGHKVGVKVRGRGRGLGDRGQMVVAGRLSINRLFLSRPHDRIPVQVLPNADRRTGPNQYTS